MNMKSDNSYQEALGKNLWSWF